MIRIQNIYHMLAYAFQVLCEQGYREMATEEFDNAAELCAAILIRGTNSQVKRGLGREYIDHTDNKAVEYLTCDELTEGLVYLTGTVDNLCSDLRLEQAVEDFFELSGEKLLAVEEVDSDNEAEQEVHKHADYVHDVGRDQIPYIVHLREKLG